MNFLREFFANNIVRRILFLLLVVLLLYSLRGMLNLLLLLFLVTFVMGRLEHFITKKISKLFPISSIVVNTILYAALIFGLVYGIANYVPKLINQISDLYFSIIKFVNTPQSDEIAELVSSALSKLELEQYGSQALNYILKIGKWAEVIIFVIVLSYFYLIQKKTVNDFTDKLSKSKISWAYNEFKYFGQKFTSSFGKVIEVQLMIALFNTILTTIGLSILGYPYLFALTIMVFLLSLIPVVGVVISFIPISIIGYQIGGISTVIWAIAMILLIHAVETYFLNPKLYAHKTKLPMFYTFIVLIFSQHFMGIWGLIIGIPIFMFLLDIFEVDQSNAVSSKKKLYSFQEKTQVLGAIISRTTKIKKNPDAERSIPTENT